MAAALTLWKSGELSIADERADPSWNNALSFVALAFMSASLGVQGVLGKRLNTQFGTTIVLTTVWVELVSDPRLFKLRQKVVSRDHKLLAAVALFIGAFVGRALLGKIGSAGTLGIGTSKLQQASSTYAAATARPQVFQNSGFVTVAIAQRSSVRAPDTDVTQETIKKQFIYLPKHEYSRLYVLRNHNDEAFCESHCSGAGYFASSRSTVCLRAVWWHRLDWKHNANSYWVGLNGYSTTDMNKAFADIAASGGTTVRTWGFNEVTTASGNYYQLWSGSTATVNTGASGLQNFDNVVAAAKANGIRLIVALTNNWADYGGLDVYVKQILNSGNHDLFYTDATVIAAYKNYIKTFVSRYANEPTILAWELANEPRCKGSTGTTSGSCTTATIIAWVKEISAYIKSLDSNHLVAIGDEGFYNQPSASTYPYQGSEGVDFDANLAISTVDFGTFHSYPEPWGQSANSTLWGTQWIKDHAASQKSANKPVILEEYGVTTAQTTTYAAWWDAIVSSGLAGDLIWQAGSHLSVGDTANDGYAVYPDGAVYPLLTAHNAALKARG
ncbi:hypothetical protein H0H87_010887 [Tephrocybe sp. NHM501043]|nr:hypothetical protein H0H87_010887 [Tephrocybe sp. NHM501043]